LPGSLGAIWADSCPPEYKLLNACANFLAFTVANIILSFQFGLQQNHSLKKTQKGDPTMAKRVVIDTDECIGCESCVELCSEVFAFNEAEEKAEVILPEGGPEDCIEEAIETCPVECIFWEDTN
jgi:ferredoxin